MPGWLWFAIGVAVGWLAARWPARRSERAAPAVAPPLELPAPEPPGPAAEAPDPGPAEDPGPDPDTLPAGVPALSSSWLQWPLLAPGEPHEVAADGRGRDELLRVAGAGAAARTMTAQLWFDDAGAAWVFVGGRRIGTLPADEAEELRDVLGDAAVAEEPFACRARLAGGTAPGPGPGLELDLEWPPRRMRPDDPFLPGGGSVEVDGVEAHAARLAELADVEGSRLVATLVEGVGPEPRILVRLGGEAMGALPPPETAAYLPIVRAATAAGLPATCEAEIEPGPGFPRLELSLAPAPELAGEPRPRATAEAGA